MNLHNRWAEVEIALDSILDLPPAQWRAACVQAAGNDKDLYRELCSLIEHADGFDPVFDRPLDFSAQGGSSTGVNATDIDGTGSTRIFDGEGSVPVGTRIGAFRIEGLIGRGGMGEVYRASRADGQFEQFAAVKIMQRGAAAVLARFQVERQILARLEHPGIARLLDGGVTGDGRAYMIMELVPGRSIVQWCRQHRCDLDQRLHLFDAICDAVAYAHRNLVVHRDLKPTNVLVTAEGSVKLLDFGVAKLLDAGSTELTQQAPLTPAYAAPEQLLNGIVTTATDVYALGLLLFEMLTDTRPWRYENVPLVVTIQKILHETPPLMSDLAGSMSEPPVAPSVLRGDLDAIVAKAMRKEPGHRYESVAALQLDLARSRRAEPVAARSHARLYVLDRFLRRHRVAVAAATVIVLLAVAAVSAIIAEARRAEREARHAISAKDFLVSVFSASDPRIPSDKPRGQITAKELMDANADRIPKEFAANPATEIELLGMVAAIYRELHDLERYRALNTQMLLLARQYYGPNHPVVIANMLDEAEFDSNNQDFDRAAKLLIETDGLLQKGGLDRSALRARWLLAKATTLSPDPAAQKERLATVLRSIALFEAVAPTDPNHETALTELGTIYTGRQEPKKAAYYYQMALDVGAKSVTRNQAEVQTIYGNLGLAQQLDGDYAAAVNSFAKAEEIGRRTYGAYDRHDWPLMTQHARTLHLMGNRQAALPMFASLIAVLPPEATLDHDAAVVREYYGACLSAEGRPALAIALLESATKTYALKPAFYFERARALLSLGGAYESAGRTADARRTLKQVLDERTALGPPAFQPLLAARERWGRFLLGQSEIDGAREQFREVISQARGRHLSHIALAYGGLARAALMQNDLTAAQAFAQQSIELFAVVEGFRDVRMGPYLWTIQARVLLASGNVAAARTWAERAVDAFGRYDDPGSQSLADANELLLGMAPSLATLRRTNRLSVQE